MTLAILVGLSWILFCIFQGRPHPTEPTWLEPYDLTRVPIRFEFLRNDLINIDWEDFRRAMIEAMRKEEARLVEMILLKPEQEMPLWR